MNQVHLKYFQIAGGLLILTGAALQVFEFNFAKYVFSAGALILILLQMFFVLKSNKEDKRIKRLNRLLFLVTATLGVAAYLMFTGANSWVVMVLLYAVLTVFLSFRGK